MMFYSKTLAVFLLLSCPACGDGARTGDAGGSGDSGDDAIDGGSVVEAGVDTPEAGEDAITADAVSWPDSGTDLPSPNWVDLTIGPRGSCPALVPCGGEIVGTWDVGGGCFELDLESALASCPGAEVTRRTGRARGRVVFNDDGTAHRQSESEVEADFFFPALCASVVSCDALEIMIRGLVSEATCETNGDGSCDCSVAETYTIDNRAPYSTEGSEIVAAGGAKRWEYCVEDNTLSYRDVSPAPPREPGLIILSGRMVSPAEDDAVVVDLGAGAETFLSARVGFKTLAVVGVAPARRNRGAAGSRVERKAAGMGGASLGAGFVFVRGFEHEELSRTRASGTA